MKINSITTIVDLAFNLSGSLAGIPVILPQLPVGERVGFAALPDLWEDVDDIGQTWTPDLNDVEVDITVEAYNPTAIQKVPYSSDMGCIDVAAGWGDALLEVLESGDYVPITNIPFGVTYVDSVRVINPNQTSVQVRPAIVEADSSFTAFIFVRPAGVSVSQSINVNPNNSDEYRIGWSAINVPLFRGRQYVNGETAEIRPYPNSDLWYGRDTSKDWFDEPLKFNVTMIVQGSEEIRSVWKAPFDTGWAFERNIFVKIRR